MAISQPVSTDPLNSPDHSLMHRQIATDPSAPVQSLIVNNSGNVGIGIMGPSTALQVVGTVTATAFSGNLTGSVTGTASGNLVAGDITGKANIASPTFTGTVTLPTATNTVPALKLPTGTNLSTTQAGALENDGSHLYFTFANSGTRFQLDQQTATVNLTTSTATNLTGFIKGNGSVLSADNSTYALTNQTMYLGTTSVAINRGTGALSLAGVSIDGSAGTAGTVTTAAQTNITSLGILTGLTVTGATTLNTLTIIFGGSSGAPSIDFYDATQRNGNIYVSSGQFNFTAFPNVPMNFATNNTNRVAISGAGNVQFTHYGAGVATFDASGNITSASDMRLKTPQGDFTEGLPEILKLQPRLFNYNDLSGLDTANIYAGLYAQEVLPYIPEAIGKGNDGYYTFNDRPVVLALINAIKELQKEIDQLKAQNKIAINSYTVTPIVGEDRILSSQKAKSKLDLLEAEKITNEKLKMQ